MYYLNNRKGLREENVYEQKVALRSWMHWVKVTFYFVSSEKR